MYRNVQSYIYVYLKNIRFAYRYQVFRPKKHFTTQSTWSQIILGATLLYQIINNLVTCACVTIDDLVKSGVISHSYRYMTDGILGKPAKMNYGFLLIQ